MTIIDPVREIEAPLLSPAEQDLARVAQRCIMAALDHSRAAAIKLTTDNGEQTPVEVPPAALKVIGQLLGAMGQGQSVVLMPMEREFTTVEAAHFLNVSRPFVIKEMEYGGLAGRVERVGLQWRSCTQQALTEIVLGTGTYPDKAAYPRLDATTGHRDRSGQAG